ncbi:MAG TPA: YajQ family cyclic di-GMP-binding protein [Candidatus Saccharimonadales bacterium]|jgi:hypothetical protein
MANYSFDIVSDYDKAEMNNAYQQAVRDISTRYDLRGTPAAIEWLDDKKGMRLIAANDMHLQAIIDMVTRAVIKRELSPKVLDFSKDPVTANLKVTQEVPFIAGLDSDKAKQVSKLVRDTSPKLKPTIQGDAVRVVGSSKDGLQTAMQALRGAELDYPISFINFR